MLSLLKTLVRVVNDLPPDEPWRKRQFVISRFIFHPVYNYRWIERAQSLATRYGLDRLPRDIIHKLLGHYVRYGWSVGRRFAVLTGHHRLAESLVPAAVRAALWRGEVLHLGTITDRGMVLRLCLSRSLLSREEGELCLWLEDPEDGVRLAMITFVMMPQADGLAVVIGGLQGAPAHIDKHRIVTATRRFSGLRPKAALVVAVQSFAATVGAQALFAVSRRNHVSQAKNRRHIKRIQADYDAFWNERGGTPAPDVGFNLPLLGDLDTKQAEAATAQAQRQVRHMQAIAAMVRMAFTTTVANGDHAAGAGHHLISAAMPSDHTDQPRRAKA